MCPWRGKLRSKVYFKDKPTPWGIKMYKLCEASSGYVYCLKIYAAQPNMSNRLIDVVLQIMNPMLDKTYHLFTDNYYTCPELYETLIKRKTHCTGTVKSNQQ
ncbi:PiggyBac transposable element-derived protein 4 [Plakobranchus ocellatus]|uniref:PiggyBac transposable element-derived protein 4 n=1 Tax=Plakobranchus ocellatus TaxID=259542 RepID=A0AAV3YE71_9GAST|nr:PiggyBac transposable element-derived protein 4 [Plakobranchus ocellatus]